MKSHEDQTSSENRRSYVSNGRSLFEVISVSENFGLAKDQMPIIGAELEDCRDGKRYFVDHLLMLTLEEVTPN